LRRCDQNYGDMPQRRVGVKDAGRNMIAIFYDWHAWRPGPNVTRGDRTMQSNVELRNLASILQIFAENIFDSLPKERRQQLLTEVRPVAEPLLLRCYEAAANLRHDELAVLVSLLARQLAESLAAVIEGAKKEVVGRN
jgi:hypothetical protein